MGIFEERDKMWKEAEERAKAMKEKEKAIIESSKGFKGKKEPDEIYEQSKKMHSAYKDYNESSKKPGIFEVVGILSSDCRSTANPNLLSTGLFCNFCQSN
jgi:hypothetical protein